MKRPRFQRSDIVFLLLMVGLVGLMGRLGWMLHGNDRAEGAQAAAVASRVENEMQGVKIIRLLPARTGNILGRSRHSLVLLAGSRQVPSIFLDPGWLTPQQLGLVAGELSEVLDMDSGDLYAQLCLRSKRRFAWVKREIVDADHVALRAWKKDLAARAKLLRATGEKGRARAKSLLRMGDAVGIQYEWRREYPNGSLAGTVLGFCRKDGEPGNGLELAARRALQGHDGKHVQYGDVRHRAISSEASASVQPIDGKNVVTSIDVNIQRILQKAVSESVEKYGGKWGVGLVINPHTGDILGMCSSPNFDPNQYRNTPPERMLNRALCNPFEPGSVFKAIMAAAAVNAGVVTYSRKIDCENGVYHASRGGRISDHGHSYGWITLTDIVVKSSNIGMAKIGEMLGNGTMFDLLQKWGFGQKTDICLSGETRGIVRKKEKWDGYSLRRIPFGQEISTSALQLGMAFSAIANGGVLMKPRLVQAITDSRGQVVRRYKPVEVRRVLSANVARQTRDVLGQVVERGTGKRCQIDQWTSWGKTGTAQIPGIGGYAANAYTGSFIGGAPVARPAVVCLISIYWPDSKKGYYGGTVAAPYVKEVLEQTLTYLNIPSDKTDATASR